MSDKRNIVFIINTPGQAYTWRNLINEFLNNKFQVRILVRDFGVTKNVLTSFGFEYIPFNVKYSKATRYLGAINHINAVYRNTVGLNATAIIGFGVDAAITAVRLKIPCFIFTDGDQTPIQNTLVHLFSNVVFTPECFKKNLGKKQIRIKGYKELAYLHPSRFTPDPNIFDELNIKPDTKYVILRFNAFKAIHDIGQRGLTISDRIIAAKEISSYYRVFISSEGDLPSELESYKIPIAPHRIHHALYYAQMILSDTGTMSVEAAVLGTPAIICFSKVDDFGNFKELENKYGLIYTYKNGKEAIAQAKALLQQHDLKERWAEKRKIMLNDKIDVTNFIFDYINKYLV